MTKKLFDITKPSIYLVFLIIAGLFLIIELVITTVMLTVKPESTFLLVPIALPAAAGLATLIISIRQTYSLYHLSINMGITRKNTLRGLLALLFAQSVLAMIFAELLSLFDLIITYKVWRAYIPGLYIAGAWDVISSWIIAAIAFAAPMLGFSFSSALLCFGPKALWIIWGGYMILCFAPSAIGSVFVSTPLEVLYLIPAAILIFFAWAVNFLRKASVK